MYRGSIYELKASCRNGLVSCEVIADSRELDRRVEQIAALYETLYFSIQNLTFGGRTMMTFKGGKQVVG